MPKVDRTKNWPTPFKKEEITTPLVARDDPRFPIFAELYMVRVPAQQARSLEDIRTYGVPVTGIDSYDQQIQREEKRVMLPISRMTELFKEGCKIGVCLDSDTRRIYEAITKYLEMWKHRIVSSINKVTIPYEDLLDLDAFAHAIYEKAKWQFDDQFISLHMSHIRAKGVGGLMSAIRLRDKEEGKETPFPRGVTVRYPTVAREKFVLPQVELEDGVIVPESDHAQRESFSPYFKAAPTPQQSGSFKITELKPAAVAQEQRKTATNPNIERLLGNLKGSGN